MFQRLLYFLGGKLVKIYTKLLLRMDVLWHSPLPKGPKIIVTNHPTTSDPFILTSITNNHTPILIKKILFDVPIFGKYLRLAGHIPVVEGKGHEAFKRALNFLNKGKSVIVFIEGNLSSQKLSPKTGAVRLALSSGKPIIPMGIGVKKANIKLIDSIIRGTKEIGNWYFKGPYAITVGKPIKIFGNIKNKCRVKILSNNLMQEIIILAKQSSKRISSLSVS